MEKEGNGFVVKDRRSFDEKGDLKDEEKVEEKGVEGTSPDGGAEDAAKESPQETAGEQPEGAFTESGPLPEVNFNSLILSLSSSALLHLGEIADPQTGEKRTDIHMAKHSIDIIAMLKEKTEGNLTDEEHKFVESILTDLRWRYVKMNK
jgi:hypothetical protein